MDDKDKIRTFEARLQIPINIRHTLLPLPDLDILSFLDFSLPPLSTNTHPTASFSLASPTYEDVSAIRKLPLPSQETIHALYRGREDAISQGLFLSLRYASPSRTSPSLLLPLWVLTFWDKVLRLRVVDGAYTLWKKAETSLRARCKVWNTKVSSAAYNAVKTTYTMLSTLSWGGFIRGFDNQEPIERLATYTTREWFSDSHEDQMLDLLRLAVSRRPEGQQYEVENVAFWKFLARAYKKWDCNTYLTDRYFVRARGLGESLANGSRDVVVMIVNLSNVHWVGVAVDF